MRPWPVAGSAYCEFISGMRGSLAAVKDRCLIVKAGLVASFMAGATGGGRAGRFACIDIISVEPDRVVFPRTRTAHVLHRFA